MKLMVMVPGYTVGRKDGTELVSLTSSIPLSVAQHMGEIYAYTSYLSLSCARLR